MLPMSRSENVSLRLAAPVDPAGDWPWGDDDDRPELEIDDDWSLDLDDEYWDALTPDDDYEPQPDDGDFWPNQDAA